MKKTLLTFLLIGMIPFFGISQCVPNTDFTGILGLEETAYELTDSTTALSHATVGDSYETFFDMRIPSDTVIEYDLGNGPQLFDPVYLNSIAINSVSGLPMGFDWECASQDADGNITPDTCVFPGGGYGCLRLYSDDEYYELTEDQKYECFWGDEVLMNVLMNFALEDISTEKPFEEMIFEQVYPDIYDQISEKAYSQQDENPEVFISDAIYDIFDKKPDYIDSSKEIVQGKEL